MASDNPITVPTLTYTPRDLAQQLSISRAQLWRLHSAGRLPAPIYLGARAPRWRADEIGRWLAAGAPDRATWYRQQQQGAPRP